MNFSTYILGSNQFLVMCVMNHSETGVISRHINSCIVGSIHLPVMCVINCSSGKVI
jgi:hypothetical protein